MKHYGDITKLSGYDLPVVDVITGGSPCQDLSVAGKRAGLAGERSGLFMEQMRIVKEMRERDRKSGRTAWAVRPRYMVWENVPGAFSSGSPKGADFAAVIEEIIKVAEPGAAVDVCVPDRGWTKSGCFYAEDGTWSIAWRVHDAQFWGVPQRRKRIALVADFGGLSAPEILFERKGLSGDSEESGAQRQGAAGGTETGAGGTVSFHLTQDPITSEDVTPCLSSGNPQNGQASIAVFLDALQKENEAMFGCWSLDEKMGQTYVHDDMGNTLGARDYKQPQAVYSLQGAGETSNGSQGGDGYRKDVCYTLNAYDIHGIATSEPILLESNQNHATVQTDGISTALPASMGMGGGYVPMVAHALSARHDGSPQPDKGNGSNIVAYAMQVIGEYKESDFGSSCKMRDYKDATDLCRQGSTVRRLTPLECERLQGYPDGWTDIGEWTDSKGKKHKEADSPRYKALGNSIALPFWAWMARRICAQYERPMTMASLFDGIGGFPLVFSRAGATPVWASEIEEFCIAVTKIRFPKEEKNE